MLEFDETEYAQSTVEDSELIAVLSFYAHLPAAEAIAIKDRLLYDGHIGSDSSDIGVRSNLEFGHRDSAGYIETPRLEPQP